MRGDFSRIRFNRRKNYTAVLEQQGRVALDADANEQYFVNAYESQTRTIDAIGQFGGPAGDDGFDITVVDNDKILIGPGRYYVHGLLCENPASLSYDSQPYLVDPANSASSLLGELAQSSQTSVLQVYLEVWQRLVTGLDDPGLREPALGQADTTARLQTVWRVVADLVPAPAAQSDQAGPMPPCCQDMYTAAASPPSTGTMTAGLSGPSAECGCQPVAAAGYQGIENQLYRVEIHHGSDHAPVTWKWSRENGSVVTAITKVSGATVFVSSLPPDSNLGFQQGQWVELTDDALEFGRPPNAPGPLYQILNAPQPTDPNPSVTLVVPANQTISVNPALNARMRRWDMSGPTVTAAGLPLSQGSPIQLENGIQVTFGARPSGPGPVLAPPPIFHSGDYWTIPARAATGQIEWPPCGSDANSTQLPTSVVVHRAPLACIHATVIREIFGGTVNEIINYYRDECRTVFSPLTALAPPAIPPAIHVGNVSWANDEVMPLDQLVANGIQITLDKAPVSPITPANFIVTVETANALPNGANPIATIPGESGEGTPAPTTILRTPTIVDTLITPSSTASGAILNWQLPFDNAPALQQLTVAMLDFMAFQGAPAKRWALVRVRLVGQMIYAAGAAGQVYLDGRALGQPGTRPDGSARTDLKLPSGADVVASDFEGWFYLAPTLQIVSVSIANSDLTVVPGNFGGISGVVVTGTTGPEVSPTAVVNLNYPATAAATISLVLTGAQGVGTIASAQATVPISPNDLTVPVPINVLDNPGLTPGTTTPVKDTFTITATLSAAAGPASAANQTFSVTGAPPRFHRPGLTG